MARGGKGQGGGGQLFCTFCGSWYPPAMVGVHGRGKCGDRLLYRGPCNQCRLGIPIGDGYCTNCEQKKGKGKKKLICPSCQFDLTATGACSIGCGWERGSWQCKHCEHWYKAVQLHCPRCTRECDVCHKCIPVDKVECPFCTIPVENKLQVIKDEDRPNRRWELNVSLLCKRGSQPFVPTSTKIRFHDPLATAFDRKVGASGYVFHAPYHFKERQVTLYAREVGEHVEVVLPARPLKRQHPPADRR